MPGDDQGEEEDAAVAENAGEVGWDKEPAQTENDRYELQNPVQADTTKDIHDWFVQELWFNSLGRHRLQDQHEALGRQHVQQYCKQVAR